MDFVRFIKKRELYGDFNVDQHTFHLAFGVDRFFIAPMGVMLTSLMKNNPTWNLVCHIFINSITKTDKSKLVTFANKYLNVRLELFYVDERLFQQLQCKMGYTAAIYNRILAAKLLYPTVDKLLYVDADTLCVGKLDEFAECSFEGKLFMAVPDRGGHVLGHKRELGLKNQEYFNSGVLYIDLQKWNREELSEGMVKLLQQRQDFCFPDQDALNILAGKYGKALPERFNYFCLFEDGDKSIPKNTVILHFAGSTKPWHPWSGGTQKFIYQRYSVDSLWADFQYTPRNYRENRWMGRYCRESGNWLSALRWYWRYLRLRNIEKRKR